MYPDNQLILVFKTNIRTCADRLSVKAALDNEEGISNWNVDMHDVDCVLRIETPGITTHEVIAIINRQGYQCSVLE
ncbi:tRNA G26 N,N-dimethylase Trm1 [Filimonas zeae]|uniref:Copper chaperone n=1 Tax=Filimonas zeae TaxID=1737353 RepID=A0A917J2Z4_9BACT|nr:hypothetical protein [Filimonas zeae]MDR6342098.1 tRNA G26 N,N-dimethylase Trm1 [Filimonas zeae]GGH79114.1 hypothetical protein GCM10011379_47990 [Filimonas zeae]